MPNQKINMDNIEDLTVSIYVRPHHSFGYLKSLLVMQEDEGLLIIVQKQSDKDRPLGAPFEIIDDVDYEERKIESFNSDEIINLISDIKYIPLKLYEFSRLGGTFFGVKVEYGFTKVTFEWHGSISTFDPEIVKIFQYVDNI